MCDILFHVGTWALGGGNRHWLWPLTPVGLPPKVWQTLFPFLSPPNMGSNRGSGRGAKPVPPLDIELSNENAPGSSETSEKTAASNWGDYCVDTCLYHGHHNIKEMVRCCHCASWMHNDCFAQTEEFFFRETGPVSDAGSYLSRSWTSRPQLPPLPSLYKTCPKLQLSYRNNTNRRLAFWRRKTRPIRDSSQKINSCDRGLLMCPQPLVRKHGDSFPDPMAWRFSGAV